MLDFGAALHAEKCVCGVVVVALRAQHRRLSAQLIQQQSGGNRGRPVEEAPSGTAFSIVFHLGEGAREPKPAIESRQTRCRTVEPAI